MDSNRKLSLQNGSIWKKSTSFALAALLLFSTAAVAWTIAPQNAYAAVSITSSSDKFFGSAFNRVLITDTTLLGSPADTISVTVEARRGSTSLASATVSVLEIGTSGTFELFLTTQSGGSPANPTNTAGICPCIAEIRTGGDVVATLQDGDVLRITYGGMTKDISFASTIATVSSDRAVAGTNNLITFRIVDQDGNNDPTAVDTINATGIIQALIGGVDKADLDPANVATETGQNTNTFEVLFNVSAAASPTIAGIDLTGLTLPQSTNLRIIDHKVYEPIPAGATAPFNAVITTTNNPSVSVTLRNDDAVIALENPVTLTNGIQPRVLDNDRDIDTSSADVLAAGVVTVMVEGIAGQVDGIELEETGDSTKIFLPLLADNRIEINVGASNSVGPTSITLTPATIASDPDITILYMDPFGSNNAPKNFTLVTSLAHSPGVLTGPSNVGVTDLFSLTANDPDWNTDPSTVQSYIVTLTGSTSTATPFFDGAAEMRLRVANNAITLLSPLTINFIENGPNSPEFIATNIDMSIVSAATTLSDGDTVSFRLGDNMQSPQTTSTANIVVGKPGNAISVDRSTVPVPMPLLASVTSGGVTYSAVPADTVKVRIQVTDPIANTNAGSTETVTIGTAAIEGRLSDGTAMILSGGSAHLTVNGGSAISLTETTVSSGVFARTIDIVAGPGFNLNLLNGATIKFTYAGEVSASVTLRLNDLVVSTDMGVVANGGAFIITASDGDRNLDPNTVEEIEVFLLARNDNIGGAQSFILEETGPNTGVFRETIEVGKDIKVSDPAAQDFSRNIEIKIRERVATDGTQGAIKERTITVTTATGSISVTPEVVGPGTLVTVRIHDFDQNSNPEGTETIPGSNDFVRIATDRTAVGSATPDAEETGANDGIFEFEIKLVPHTTGAIMTTSGTEVTVPVLPGDVLAIRYTDNKDASGNRVTVSRVIMIQSFDPDMSSNIQVVDVGGSATITIVDADANVDGDVVDSIQLKVESTSDPVGFTVSALETGPNEGVFTATISTSRQVEAGSIMARVGDTLTIRYTDKYPADYSVRVRQVVDPSKDFVLVLSIGVGEGGPTTTSPSAPQPRDINGQPVSQVLAGQQIILSTTVRNNDASPTAATILLEVRDSNGVTIYLQFQQATISANGDVTIGASFTPDEPDQYNVRTFVISDFVTLRILSPVQQSTLNVS